MTNTSGHTEETENLPESDPRIQSAIKAAKEALGNETPIPREQPPEETDPSFRITPKGWLHIKLNNGNLKYTEDLWNDLTEFVRKQAASNGMTEGVPCLVLADGGHCITAEKRDKPK